jgi:hypothetical protein
MTTTFLGLVCIFLCFSVAWLAYRDVVRGKEIAFLRQALDRLERPYRRRDLLPPSSSQVLPIESSVNVRIVAPPAKTSEAEDATLISVRPA